MKVPIFVVAWALPNFFAGLPFLTYFTRIDRTPWMIKNGFETGEMKSDHTFIVNTLIVLVCLFVIITPILYIKDYIHIHCEYG